MTLDRVKSRKKLFYSCSHNLCNIEKLRKVPQSDALGIKKEMYLAIVQP